MKKRVNFVGEERGENNEWLVEAAGKIQGDFVKHKQGFVLIPWVDVDDAESIENTNVGTCVTDCTDPFMFAIAMAGAICSFSITSDNENKDGEAAQALVKAIGALVSQVTKMKGGE